MTKLRSPDSIEDGVMQAIGLIGAETLAMALSSPTGRMFSASLLRKWADPDNHANRIDGASMRAIDLLLHKSGHQQVFKPIFDAIAGVPIAEAPATPTEVVAQAIESSVNAGHLLEVAYAAAGDLEINWQERCTLLARIEAQQKLLARLKRALLVKPKQQARK